MGPGPQQELRSARSGRRRDNDGHRSAVGEAGVLESSGDEDIDDDVDDVPATATTAKTSHNRRKREHDAKAKNTGRSNRQSKKQKA